MGRLIRSWLATPTTLAGLACPATAGVPIDLDSYYELKVIGGSGAFSMIAHSDIFAPTILRKLVREIAEPQPAGDAGHQLAEAAP